MTFKTLTSELAMALLYIHYDLNCTKIPYRFNINDVEITITVLSSPIPNIHVVGIYRSKTNVTISQLIEALTHLHNSVIADTTLYTHWGFQY